MSEVFTFEIAAKRTKTGKGLIEFSLNVFTVFAEFSDKK